MLVQAAPCWRSQLIFACSTSATTALKLHFPQILPSVGTMASPEEMFLPSSKRKKKYLKQVHKEFVGRKKKFLPPENCSGEGTRLNPVKYTLKGGDLSFKRNFFPSCGNTGSATPAEDTQHGADTIITDIADTRLPDSFRTYFSKASLVQPTPIQGQCWPAILSGNNVVACAPTGSGKTLGFLLPMIPHVCGQRKVDMGKNQGPVCLVLAPTRELALQISTVAKPFKRLFAIRVVCLVGGVGKEKQFDSLVAGVHVIVATPGRLIDLVSTKVVSLQRTTFLVIDEADRMLELGFEEQLDQIQGQIRPGKQTSLFSATMPDHLSDAVARWIPEPRMNIVSEGIFHGKGSGGGNVQLGISPTITQLVHVCSEHKKSKKLMKFLTKLKTDDSKKRHNTLVVVFCNKIKTLAYVDMFLKKQGVKAGTLHGKLDQEVRNATLMNFKAGKFPVLVCTDVAARGLHMKRLEVVVNWDMPPSLEQYVHRVGRTGRNGQPGFAYTFFTRNFAFLVQPLVELLRNNNQSIDPHLQELAEGTVRMAEPSGPSKVNSTTPPFEDGILKTPQTYMDGVVNLATLPLRGNTRYSSSSDNSDTEREQLNGNTDENAADATVSSAKVAAGKDRPEKVSFADEGALRGVPFKDRCWMAGVQARGVGTGNENAAGKAVCLMGDAKKRKRGKRGGKKNSKKKLRR